MVKRVRTATHGRHPVHLDTVGGVAREMARLYRLAINQRIKSAEAARLVYILREVRSSLEAIPLAPAADKPTVVNIVSVPSGHFVKHAEELSVCGMPLTIEHRPVLENMDSAPTIAPAPAEILEPEPGREITGHRRLPGHSAN